ncbi:MAG TPA: transcription-repair coupling factor [Verrucomicrobiae bacterium]|nr:transcription-repair coupling factor [Verrucomicrobiae bacterium]
MSLNSLADAGKPFIASLLSQIANRPILIVTDGLKSQEALFNDLQTLLPGVQFYPAWETLPHEDVLPHADTIADRLKALTNLNAPVTVASVQALMQKTFAPDYFMSLRLEVRLGQEIELQDFLDTLTKLGYHAEYQVNDPGDMAMRGGIVDFFPLDRGEPVRVEFSGNEIESIRTFDPITQQSREKREHLVVTPAGELGLLKQAIDQTAPLVDLLPRDTLLVLDEPDKLAEAAENYARQIPKGDKFFAEWRHTLESGLSIVQLTEALAIDPPAAYINLRLASLDAFRPLDTRSPEPEIAEQMRRSFFEQMQRWTTEGYSLQVFCSNDGEKQRFEELWREYTEASNTTGSKLEASIATLSRGFLWTDAKLAVVTDSEIFGRYKLVRPRRKFHQLAQATDWTELQEGDIVVHVQHGIGKYLGLKSLDFNGSKQEVLAIEYADEARLYVPIDQAHLVSKYLGAGKRQPPLHQLGGALWQKQKLTAERAIMDLAANLLEIQAARHTLEGHAFAPDTAWQNEFEAAFIYDETPDQLTAISEVKGDMESSKPMDRLICGDVGYGKTEVAIRAAFKAVMGGFQVAILCPTTILAEQHWNTFRERMSGYPITIEMLSRFRTQREQTKVAKLLREGGVDIVIGTHRLLSGDITFKNLGLVVVDEEQRFGVLHKERFKQLRKLIDVLTLSATPIPRTLYLSLTGARDMSTIQTPPQDRLPVETIVAAYDERLIKQAIQRELNRGGQVYFLHNRVQSIEMVAERLRDLLLESKVRIDVGHGQMDEHELEEVMHRFVKGQIDVLVCTTIIESGLDIPNANTIIIDRADRFGLSDLYQLRGRVGRYKHQAYAYILLPRHLNLVQSARKRIGAIKQYSSLGSGFKIAMRDLEIRGAGNILGSEQSGHITAIGFDLYCQLLKESIARLKGEKPKHRTLVTLKLDFLNDESGEGLARIPSNYMTDSRLRIQAYRKIAQAAELATVKSLRREFRDRFGKIPRQLELLLQCAEVRIQASDTHVETVETREDKIMLTQRSTLLQIGGKFPRFVETKPEGKLAELKTLLYSLSEGVTPEKERKR